MSKHKATASVPTDPENTHIQAVYQLRKRFTKEEQYLLGAIASEPRSISAGEWMSDFQGRMQELLRVEAFVKMRDKLLAARVVIEHPPQSGRYRATSLGRCQVIDSSW